MGRYGGNWTWYEYRAIQTLDPFVQRDPSFGRDVQSTPPQGCPLLVLCHLIPIHLHSSSCNWCSGSEQLHQRRKQNFSLKHRTSRVVLFNEINDETGCKLTEACRMENGTVMVTTCDIIKGIMTLLYHHGIDFHKWSVHICIISLHVMYQLISVAYILNIYIYIHISASKLWVYCLQGHPATRPRAPSVHSSSHLAERPSLNGTGIQAERVWPRRNFLNVMRRNHAKIGPNGWTQSQVKQCNDTGMLADKNKNRIEFRHG